MRPAETSCGVVRLWQFGCSVRRVDRLATAHHAGRLQTELVRLGRYPLLVVDELRLPSTVADEESGLCRTRPVRPLGRIDRVIDAGGVKRGTAIPHISLLGCDRPCSRDPVSGLSRTERMSGVCPMRWPRGWRHGTSVSTEDAHQRRSRTRRAADRITAPHAAALGTRRPARVARGGALAGPVDEADEPLGVQLAVADGEDVARPG